MARHRVLSFISQFSAGSKTPSPTPSPPNDAPPALAHKEVASSAVFEPVDAPHPPATPPQRSDNGSPVTVSPADKLHHRPRRRNASRPSSMLLAHQPPLMEINEDTIPELLPIFSFLNSHANKLYQEGYFLKLDDQDTQGRPNQDRTWTECFAQLVGTVLSLWDAAELDAAGEDGEVLPKFINLTDASIKMIDSLPTRAKDEQPLQNILSISTAGRNRYLLHFNSHHSLVQWTAGIRLAMFEHSTLQEAYTGALIAGKGKSLNNINIIMERSRFKSEEWVRVRFGAGVPWRRCWCVVSPPDEKETAKVQKEMKKKSPYDRTAPPALKGTIHFYDTRKEGKKQKKAQPIASITDAYSAYAIYPQAKSLVDASTLIKIEGDVTVHSSPPSSTEGFVFLMPETHPAVSGFEMMLRFLFPTWDTFGLYGRPGKLVASTLDPRSLMFAMPKHKRYGYLEIIDVASLLVNDDSGRWSEREWRRRLKEVTGARMNAMDDDSRNPSRSSSRQGARLSFGGGVGASGRARVGFADERGSVRSSRSFSLNGGPPRTDSAPPDPQLGRPQPAVSGLQANHMRNVSDPNVAAARLNPPQDFGVSNGPGPYQGSPQRGTGPPRNYHGPTAGPNGRSSQDDIVNNLPPPTNNFDGMGRMQSPEPVSRPPAFSHKTEGRPTSKAYHSPELRRANSRLSSSTLAHMVRGIGFGDKNAAAKGFPKPGREEGVVSGPPVFPQAASMGTPANDIRSREAVRQPAQGRQRNLLLPLDTSKSGSRSPQDRSPNGPPSPYAAGPNSPAFPPGSEGRRSPYPPGGLMGAPPRSPQPPGYRPAAPGHGRPPPDGRPGTPGGVSQPHGPGHPPNQHHTFPNDDPTPYGGGQRPGPPPGSRPFPGPQGPARPGGPGAMGPVRKPVPGMDTRGQGGGGGGGFPGASATDDILDAYTGGESQPSDDYAKQPAPERRPVPPSYPGGGYGGNGQGGNMGQTQARRSPGLPGPPGPFGQGQRPYSPAGQRGPAAPPPHKAAGFRPGDNQAGPWRPAVGPPGNNPGVNAEPYGQPPRGAPLATQYSDQGIVRRNSSDMMDRRQPPDDFAGGLHRPSTQGENRGFNGQAAPPSTGPQQPPPPPHSVNPPQQESGMSVPQSASFSRPLRAETQSPRPGDPRLLPPQGQYVRQPPSSHSMQAPYQGQAF